MKDNGIDAEYSPIISIIDSEQMELDVKQSLAEFLYSKLNCSLRTAYEVLGYSLEEERARRIEENESDIDTIFTPHSTAYNSSGTTSEESDDVGRPKSENPEDGGTKQDYDQDYQQTK